VRRLVVLTGAAGSGKTAIATEIDRLGDAKIVKNYVAGAVGLLTTPERQVLDRRPSQQRIAWAGEHDGAQYGMLRTELERVSPGGIGLIVVDPMMLGDIASFRAASPDIEIITVGLDTIADVTEQLRRVGADASRVDRPDRLVKIREIIATTDVNLTADEGAVLGAVRAICRIMQARGGMLTKEFIAPLLAAGSVLTNSDPALIKSASYDLRVGDEVWCAGFTDLTVNDPIFEIPPYSYAIVKAMEKAALPTFMTAQFDLRVSSFLSGIILSNGPQVDPGYRGDLFCMLFNGNSDSRTLRMGDRFSTIQFITAARVGEPYDGIYSIREKLRRSMPADVAVGPGGAIFSKMSADIENAKKELRAEFPKDRAGVFLSLISILAGISIAITLWTASVAVDANKAVSEATKGAAEANKAAVDARSALTKLEDQAGVAKSAGAGPIRDLPKRATQTLKKP
jgi:deoxycytidine triphosphate deaminase